MINVGGKVVNVSNYSRATAADKRKSNNKLFLMVEDSSSLDEPAKLVTNKPNGNLNNDGNHAKPTKAKSANQKTIATDPISKMELWIKRKIQDHQKNPNTTPTTKAAHNKNLGDIANKINPIAVTGVIEDYAKDSEAYENSQDALSHVVELKKSGV